MGRVRRARRSTSARAVAFAVASAVALAGGALTLVALLATPAPAADTRAPAVATTVNVAITDTGFTPATLDVPAGTVVVWTNEGASTHTVTSLDGSFASDELQPGATFPFQFTKTGTFQYRDIHTGVTGTITVVAGAVQGTATVPAAPAPGTPAVGTPAPGAVTNPAGGPTMAFTGTGDYVLAAAGAILLALGWSLTRHDQAVIVPFRVDRETAHTIERARRVRSEFLPVHRRPRAR